MSGAPPGDLVLASGSPRRRAMLERLGLAFTVRPVDVDETPLDGERADAYVARLAVAKAAAGARPGTLTLAADTVVVDGDRLLGKPRDDRHARRMLAALAGRWHTVITGVAVAPDGAPPPAALCHLERTRVRFAPLTAREIEWYVASGEPRDKAGAYGIQGLGALFVEAIEGNYDNVVGLPLAAVYRLLARAGCDLLALSRRRT